MRASGYERAANDYYVEPRWAIEALLDVEEFQGGTWDPSCGGGNIVSACQARHMNCWGSDIADRGFGTTGHDFFTSNEIATNIISNPPYGVIEPYLTRALSKTTGKVALLARLAFLEGQKRKPLFQRVWPLARVWTSSRRMSMPPGGTDVPARGGSIPYGWFVFEHGYTDEPRMRWL